MESHMNDAEIFVDGDQPSGDGGDGEESSFCSAVYQARDRFVLYCTLDPGHGGPHVASDGGQVVETW
jgi:hypothetical protein